MTEPCPVTLSDKELRILRLIVRDGGISKAMIIRTLKRYGIKAQDRDVAVDKLLKENLIFQRDGLLSNQGQRRYVVTRYYPTQAGELVIEVV